jgi:hypothetical protein
VETSGEKIACQGLIIKQHAYLGLKLHTAWCSTFHDVPHFKSRNGIKSNLMWYVM